MYVSLLNPFSSKQVQALQKFYMNSDSAFVVQHRPLSRMDVLNSFGYILPHQNTTGYYHVFISYR